jgi:glycerophosphoryl diester phosphodiesterase
MKNFISNTFIMLIVSLSLFCDSYAALIIQLPNKIAGSNPEKQVIPENIKFDANSLKAISISCRFQADNLPKKNVVLISACGWELGIDKKDGTAYFTADGLQLNSNNITKTDKISSYSNICDGKRHYIMGINDGKSVAIYIDGVMEDAADFINKDKAKTSAVVIRQSDKASCMIDNVKIYDNAIDYKTIAELSESKPVVWNLKPKKLDLHKDFWDRGVIPIQAHRGGGFALPEHTMETYIETWTMGMIPEADVRTTKDGIIISMHDNDTKRVAPNAPAPLNRMKFNEMTLEQVKTLDVGQWRGRPGQKVPTLEEVFAQMQGKPEIMMEFDYKAIELKQLADLVNKYNLREQIFFVSRYHHLLRQWSQIMPGSVTMIWVGGSEHTLDMIFDQYRRDDFAGM